MTFARLTRRTALIAAASIAVAGCAGSNNTRTVFESDDVAPAKSVLVVGVTGASDSRARFERALTQQLKRAGVNAVSYSSVAGGKALSRDNIASAVSAQGLDAVLVTRSTGSEGRTALKEGQSSIKETTKGGSAVNLFRYNYEVLNEPVSLSLEFDVALTSDLFSTATETLVWSGESTFKNQDNIAVFVDTATKSLVSELIDAGAVSP